MFKKEKPNINEIPFIFFFFDLILDKILSEQSPGRDFIRKHLYENQNKFDKKFEEDYNKAENKDQRRKIFGEAEEGKN